MKCEDESQVRTHLETLLKMQEQLVGMGSGLPDVDLIMILLGSLPKSYCPLVNAITVSSSHARVVLEPGKVVESLLDEFEHLSIEDRQLKAAENALAAAAGGSKSHGKGGSNMSKADHSDAECWKCGQKGHICVN